MPTYEYACTNGHRFDVVQRFSEDPLTECQTCGAPVKRVFHPVGIVLKGSGFYSTDNRPGTARVAKKEEKSQASSETKAESKNKAETKKDTKPASKESS
jgi:putative FmdB family regulatory protein